MLSRSYHTLLRLVLIGNSLSSYKEEHHTSRDQQAENYKQDNECPIHSRLDGEGINGSVTAFVRDCYAVFPFLRNRFSEFILNLLFAAIDFDFVLPPFSTPSSLIVGAVASTVTVKV